MSAPSGTPKDFEGAVINMLVALGVDPTQDNIATAIWHIHEKQSQMFCAAALSEPVAERAIHELFYRIFPQKAPNVIPVIRNFACKHCQNVMVRDPDDACAECELAEAESRCGT